MKPNSRTTTQQRGFTLTQMIVTVAIIAVVSTGGVLGIKTARAEFRLQNSARLFATYIEKARADAIRRHAAPGQESSVETFGPGSTTYAITMDYGSGVVETRNFELESGLNFATAAKRVTFDWRGRIEEAWVFQVHSEYLERNLPVDVSGSGDITVGEQHFPDQLIPPVEIAQVTGDVDSTPTPTPTPDPSATPPVDDEGDPEATPTPTPEPTPTPTPTPNGNGNGNDGDNGNGNGNGSPTPTPTPNASPSPSPDAQCTSAISPVELKLSQSDAANQTGSAVFTIVNATGTRTISASIAGNGNSLVLGVSLLRIDGSGSSVITVTTKNGAGNRGAFIVNVSTEPSCGSAQQLKVSVSN
ncbi:MAG TPA: prepilin-type N-terminal cleavage/methylation domain-containing protein [Pyrinomonadaceae bacterium]|nr:prepilin-type N-terminal cleavage/methylation domain-containing protein [Pyrinomonadaceae bacterium]